MKNKTIYGDEADEQDNGYVLTATSDGLEVWHLGEETEQINLGWVSVLSKVPKKALKAELDRRKRLECQIG